MKRCKYIVKRHFYTFEAWNGKGVAKWLLSSMYVWAKRLFHEYLYLIDNFEQIEKKGSFRLKNNQTKEGNKTRRLDRIIPPPRVRSSERKWPVLKISISVISQHQKLVTLICGTFGWRRNISTSFLQSAGIRLRKMWWLIKSVGGSKWFSWYPDYSKFSGW